ncbi:MAG: Fur family transcriptional regulator [Pyrinomonadaceae bacterium]
MKAAEIQNLGLTRQLEVLLSVIRESCGHLTANEVFAATKEILPSISFATVYKSLRYLKEAGNIAEIEFGSWANRFDLIAHRHEHAVCTECAKLTDNAIKISEDFVNRAAKY